MHVIGRSHRPGPLETQGLGGSGADWLKQYKPFLEDGQTVVCSPHRVYGPERNDLVLQLRKRGIDKVVLAACPRTCALGATCGSCSSSASGSLWSPTPTPTPRSTPSSSTCTPLPSPTSATSAGAVLIREQTVQALVDLTDGKTATWVTVQAQRRAVGCWP